MLHIKALGLEVRNMLGSGSFAQVFECYDHRQNKEYAVKMIRKEAMSRSRVRAFFKEADILEAMDHNNIVKFHSFHETDQFLLIKMELVRGGTLKQLIEKRRAERMPFSEEEIALFMRQLLQGIRYLHSLNIIHRDLKTENILFADDRDLASVKIVDFGLSAKLEIHAQKNVKAQCGTLLYMAPEIFYKPSYTKSVDIWSCAVIMYMMFSEGTHPLYSPGMNTQDFKHRLKTAHFPKLPHPLAQNFIEKISKKEYEERYNVIEALKHPWLTRNSDDEIPLSIHESYKGFDSTHKIISVLKLFLGLGGAVAHRRGEIDEGYRFRVSDFNRDNEAVRVYSPSRRRMRDKNNELFVKMKQIFVIQSDVPGSGRGSQLGSSFSEVVEENSPTIRKHESIFSRLFDRDKSFQTMKVLDLTEPKQEEQPIQKEQQQDSSSFQSNSHRFMPSSSPAMLQQERPLAKTSSFLDCDFQLKLQNQIEESVNYLRLYSKTDAKRRVFSKKASFEDKEVLGEKKMRVSKKYSDNYEIERAEEVVRTNASLSLSSHNNSRPVVYNRKPMSPLRNQYRPMVFSLSLRTYSQKHSKKNP